MTDVSPVQWVLSGTGSFSQTEGFEPLATSGASTFAVGDQPVPVEAQGSVYDSTAMATDYYDYYIMTAGNAIYWSPATGEENLTTLLDDNGLASALSGWTLTKATGISNSGTTIIGQGTDPTASAESWMVYQLGNLSSFGLSATSVVGGANATGNLALDGYSGPSGETVTLSSSSTDVVVPSTAALGSWSTSASFAITTKDVSAPESVTLTATLGDVTKTVTLSLTLPAINTFTVAPTSVVGGVSSTATLWIVSKAGPSGDTITVTSNNANAIVTPPVKVPAGTTSVTFTVKTLAVTTNTIATLTAVIGSSTKTATLTITAPEVWLFAVSPTALIGGVSTSGAVVITSPAAKTGAVIAITSSNTSVVAATTETVLGGDQVVPFALLTKPVSTTVVVNVTATLNGASMTVPLTVESAALVNLRLTSTTLVGGNSMNVAVYLNGNAGPGGTTVILSSNSPDLAVPASVVVPAGTDAFAFPVSSVGVSAATPVIITAVKGVVTLTKTVTLETATLLRLVTAPTVVVGGNPFTFGMYYTGKVGPSGLTVTLKSSSPDIVMPATYKAAAGVSQASFSVNTLAVKALTSVTLTATVGSTSVTTVVSLSP
jgi:trimeric autotransporter adhesin